MYIGNYNSSYYASLFGNLGSIYGASSASSPGSLYKSIFGNTQSSSEKADFSALSTAGDLKSQSASLGGALGALMGKSTKKIAVSSDPATMSVKSSTPLFASKDISVKIDQIATGQKNEGAALRSNGKADFASNNEFSIEIDGKTHNFSVSVSESDTNEDVQKKMADAINQRGIGVTAELVKDSETNTGKLTISADGTGSDSKNSFTVKDISGNAASLTKANNVTQEAADARYSVNGGETRTSKTNDVYLGGGVTATLKAASEKAVNVSYATDSEDMLGKLQQFADSYNKLYETAVNSSNGGNSKLFTQLVNNSKTYSGALNRVGIGFDADGRMTIDSEKAAEAAEDGSLSSFFTKGSGSSFGFANGLNKIASNVSRNTMSYVDKTAMFENLGYTSSGQSAAGLFGNSNFSSSLINLLL